MKTVIVYGSTTGNTETAAEIIRDALLQKGITADVYNAANTKPSTVAGYDLYLLGCSTWGIGDLQDDFEGFYDNMTADVFRGKKAAVFGCGDSNAFSDSFCAALDSIAEKAKDCGAEVIGELLRIDGDVDDNEDDIRLWAKGLI